MAKPALGKGLKALIDLGSEEEAARIIEVPITQVKANPHQPRQEFDPEKLQELANSIQEHGVVQPLLVTKQGGHYLLVAGERRLRAAKLANLQTVPVIVRSFDQKEQMIVSLIENIQREDLNSIEEAEAYQQLIEKFALTQEEVAAMVGKSRSAISNTIRLLGLPEEVRQSLAANQISAGHARALLALPQAELQKKVWNEVIRRGLSVRSTEALVKQVQKEHLQKKAKTPQKNPFISHFEEHLIELLGTQVRITSGRKRGKIEIEYYGEEDLTRLIELLSKIGA